MPETVTEETHAEFVARMRAELAENRRLFEPWEASLDRAEAGVEKLRNGVARLRLLAGMTPE